MGEINACSKIQQDSKDSKCAGDFPTTLVITGVFLRAQIFWKSNKIAVLLSALYLSAGLRRGTDHNYARKQPQKASLPIDWACRLNYFLTLVSDGIFGRHTGR